MIETEERLETIEVVKRNGRKVEFDGTKVALAIKKGFDNVLIGEDEINETCEILEKKLDSFLITIENNETFIFKLQKQLNTKKMKELAADKAWQEKINKANALIEKFMEDGIYPAEVDSEIEQLAIKMLQLDLNVNYKKLEVLLLYAKLKRMGQLDLDAPSVVLTLTKDN